ncbi:MAG: TonB-dependent receptor plug domain-containing protein, partial [Sphingobacterium sp.]
MRKSLLFSWALGVVFSTQHEYAQAAGRDAFFKEAFSLSVSPNQDNVRGVVSDADGPVQGVTVTVVGASTSTQTAADGRFSLRAPRGSTLQFTSVGYKAKQVPVNSAVVNVLLEATEGALEEVLVTAEFGLKRTSRAVGSSVQQIDGGTISESGRESFISALAGRVPGLNVTSTSGSPGASTTVVLRNITSISGNNQPLYVVDGVPMNNSTFDPLGGMAGSGSDSYSVRNLDFASRGNDFNPEDIESLTVLKGAAAAALYGSDASNGAIIITTKKGRAGKGRVSYSNFFKW